MNPTPEQVAQWAREAGLPVSDTFGPMVGACPVGDLLQIICTRAMAEQAEADANFADLAPTSRQAAAAIRANAPKVTR